MRKRRTTKTTMTSVAASKTALRPNPVSGTELAPGLAGKGVLVRVGKDDAGEDVSRMPHSRSTSGSPHGSRRDGEQALCHP